MFIQVTEVGEIEKSFNKKGKPYKKFMLEFLADGRAGKYVVTEYNHLYDTLLKSSPGEEFEISTKASDDGQYTNWDTATKVAQTEPTSSKVSSAKPAAPFKSTYETPEERAKKQIYIVRQSSIANAINFLEARKGTDIDEILRVARQFEEFVFGTGGEIVSDDLDDIEVK